MAAIESTPVRAGATSVPCGHAIGSEKWRGTELAKLLQGKVKVVFEDGLGLVDFHLSNRTCILYISESDLVSGNAFRRRLVRFRKLYRGLIQNTDKPLNVTIHSSCPIQIKLSACVDKTDIWPKTGQMLIGQIKNTIMACNLNGIVIAERTRLSDQYYPPVQNFVVLELGMALLPVTNQNEAAQLIFHLVQERSREGNCNLFIRKKSFQLPDASVLQTVQKIPGVGRVKALQLLQHFPSIQKLSNASVAQLESVLGRAIALNIHSFFHTIT